MLDHHAAVTGDLHDLRLTCWRSVSGGADVWVGKHCQGSNSYRLHGEEYITAVASLTRTKTILSIAEGLYIYTHFVMAAEWLTKLR